MLYDETQRDTLPKKPEVDIWRFMIDKKHQNKGYGRRVLEIVVSELKARQCFESVKLSYVPGNDSAVELYKSVGFVETGEIEEGEVIMSLNFQSESHK
jgi:diamine N-acetyltransferase